MARDGESAYIFSIFFSLPHEIAAAANHTDEKTLCCSAALILASGLLRGARTSEHNCRSPTHTQTHTHQTTCEQVHKECARRRRTFFQKKEVESGRKREKREEGPSERANERGIEQVHSARLAPVFVGHRHSTFVECCSFAECHRPTPSLLLLVTTHEKNIINLTHRQTGRRTAANFKSGSLSFSVCAFLVLTVII